MKATLRIAIISLLMLSVTVIANAQTTEKKALTIEGAKKVIAAALAVAAQLPTKQVLTLNAAKKIAAAAEAEA